MSVEFVDGADVVEGASHFLDDFHVLEGDLQGFRGGANGLHGGVSGVLGGRASFFSRCPSGLRNFSEAFPLLPVGLGKLSRPFRIGAGRFGLVPEWHA